MNLTAKQLNKFIIFKLPSAYLCGVKVDKLDNNFCITKVKFRWINKNPFKSIYFAVLAMAAELSTGAIVLKKTRETNYKFSTLVVGMNAEFYKKAIGEISFICDGGTELVNYVNNALLTKEGEVFKLVSKGVDKEGEIVAKFEFTWSIKLKEPLN